MMKPSKIIATVAGAMQGGHATALMRLAEILKHHDENVTIVAEQSVQDIEASDILIGSTSVRLRGIVIPFEDLRIESRIPIASLPTPEDIMAGEACVLSYGGNNGSDRSFLTVAGRDTGNQIKIHYAVEALDVAANHSINTGSRLLVSEGMSDECTIIEACAMTVDQEGIHLGGDNHILWTDVTAMTVQDTLSLAIGRKRMMTISES